MLACDVGAVVVADLAVVDGLARLQLVARAGGATICLVNASAELRGLLGVLGLGDALPCDRDA